MDPLKRPSAAAAAAGLATLTPALHQSLRRKQARIPRDAQQRHSIDAAGDVLTRGSKRPPEATIINESVSALYRSLGNSFAPDYPEASSKRQRQPEAVPSPIINALGTLRSTFSSTQDELPADGPMSTQQFSQSRPTTPFRSSAISHSMQNQRSPVNKNFLDRAQTRGSDGFESSCSDDGESDDHSASTESAVQQAKGRRAAQVGHRSSRRRQRALSASSSASKGDHSTQLKPIRTWSSLRVPRFDLGALARTCHVFQLDVRTVVRRIMLMLVSSNMALLDRVLAGNRLPFNLLEPCAPYLRAHLQSMLLSTRWITPQEARLRMLTDYAFDGVHLTMVGFAAALDAERRHGYTANVPREGTYILTSPRRRVHTSADGGANLTTDERGSVFDVEDGVWSPSVALSTLYSRWPHLLCTFRSATAPECNAVKSFLEAERLGESVSVPQILADLYFKFLQTGGEPVSLWVHRPGNADAMQMAGQTEAFLSLMGLTQADLVRYIWNDADADPFNSIQWMHPTTVQRRALAALTAANNSLSCHSFEGVHLRKVEAPSWHRSASRAAKAAASGAQWARPCSGNAGAGGDPDSETDEEDATPTPASTFYVPFYALQTQHTEKFPNGCKSVDVLYLSDVMHCRQPQPVHAIQTALGEIEALQMLLQDVSAPSLSDDTQAAGPPEGRRQLQSASLSAARGKVHSGLPPKIQRLLAMSENTDHARSTSGASSDAHHAELRHLLAQQDKPGDQAQRAEFDVPRQCAHAEVTATIRRTGSRNGALTSALSTLDSDTAHRLLKRLVMVLCQETDPLLQCKLRLHEPPTPFAREYVNSMHQGSSSTLDVSAGAAAARLDRAKASAASAAEMHAPAQKAAETAMQAKPIGGMSPTSTLKHEIALQSALSGENAQDIALRCFAPALNGLTRPLLRKALTEARAALGMQALCKAQAGLIDLATHEPETLVFAWGPYSATYTYPWVSLRLAAQRWLFPPVSQDQNTHVVQQVQAAALKRVQGGAAKPVPAQVTSNASDDSLGTADNPGQAADSLLPTFLATASSFGSAASASALGPLGGPTSPRLQKLEAAFRAQRSALAEKAVYEGLQASRRESGDSNTSIDTEFSASLERAAENAVTAAYAGPSSLPLHKPGQGGQQESAPDQNLPSQYTPGVNSGAGGGSINGSSSEGAAAEVGGGASDSSHCSDCGEEEGNQWAQWPPNTCGSEGKTATG